MQKQKESVDELKKLLDSFDNLYSKLPKEKRKNYKYLRLSIKLLSGGITASSGRLKRWFINLFIKDMNMLTLIKKLPKGVILSNIQIIIERFKLDNADPIEKEILTLLIQFLIDNKSSALMQEVLSLGYKYWSNIDIVLKEVVLPSLAKRPDDLDNSQEDPLLHSLILAENIINLLVHTCQTTRSERLILAIQNIQKNKLFLDLFKVPSIHNKKHKLIQPVINDIIDNIILDSNYSNEQKIECLENIKQIILYLTQHKIEAEIAAAEKNSQKELAQKLKQQLSSLTSKQIAKDIKHILYTEQGNPCPGFSTLASLLISITSTAMQDIASHSIAEPLHLALRLLEDDQEKFVQIDFEKIKSKIQKQLITDTNVPDNHSQAAQNLFLLLEYSCKKLRKTQAVLHSDTISQDQKNLIIAKLKKKAIESIELYEKTKHVKNRIIRESKTINYLKFILVLIIFYTKYNLKRAKNLLIYLVSSLWNSVRPVMGRLTQKESNIAIQETVKLDPIPLSANGNNSLTVQINTKAHLEKLYKDFNKLYNSLPADTRKDYKALKNILRVLPFGADIFSGRITNSLAKVALAKLPISKMLQKLTKSTTIQQAQANNNPIVLRYKQNKLDSSEKAIFILILDFIAVHKDGPILHNILSVCHDFWGTIDNILNRVVLPIALKDVRLEQFQLARDILTILKELLIKADNADIKQDILTLRQNPVISKLINQSDTGIFIDTILNNIIYTKHTLSEKQQMITSIVQVLDYLELSKLMQEPCDRTRKIELQEKLGKQPLKSILFEDNNRLKSTVTDILSLLVSIFEPIAKKSIGLFECVSVDTTTTQISADKANKTYTPLYTETSRSVATSTPNISHSPSLTP